MSFIKNLFSKGPKQKVVEGFLDWKFGMTREEVCSQNFGPYENVESTGGVMTYQYPFAGKPTPISFLFNERGLYRIQIWAYQGQDFNQAAKAFAHVWNHMKITGEIESTGLRLENIKSDQDFIDTVVMMLGAPNHSGSERKLQMRVRDVSPENVSIFTSLIDHPQNIFVFLYYDRK